ncbi:hypothetical protein [Brachybacterium sp. GCM10030252]|uniref:hypothetical protein n=1 Tax=Brachybacterium sp. GCM10030252 TaxID=3273380 RepID=UPI00361EA875
MTIAMTSAPDSEIFSSAQRPRSRWGLTALVLGLLALVGGVACAGYVGVTLVPAELEAGGMFGDTAPGYQRGVIAAGLSLLLWAGIGIVALATGSLALVRRERRGRGMAVGGMIAALVAPVLWLAGFAVPVVMAASAL